MSLSSIQNKAVKHFGVESGGQQFDVAFIDVFAQIIADFIIAFRECQSSADDAVGLARRPSWLQRRMMRVRVRRSLGWREYIQHGRKVERSLLKTGKDVTVEEMQEAFDEIG